ncbi:MAG: hypothetical protein R2685_09935 [Candidatus Nitrosocosmicus sp.]|nr:hypothetical protein [Candidatus Nitrosocosmicus sp.]
MPKSKIKSKNSKETKNESKRGLATASAKTRERVARAGGLAKHEARGLQAANHETRIRVARSGGKSSKRKS